jgi:hypothetical protein
VWLRDFESFQGDVIVERMSEVRKGVFRNTKNDNNSHKQFNMVLHMNWDYISVTAVEHMSLLNRPGICDGIICCLYSRLEYKNSI